jgi:predicted transcriptional regulator
MLDRRLSGGRCQIERCAMKEIDVHVGYDPQAQKKRVLKAVRRAEAGARVGERHITFESWEGLARTLTRKRLELLKRLRAFPAANIAELARALGRDYKRVHEDVEILSSAGLVARTDDGTVRADYDEIRASIALSPATA